MIGLGNRTLRFPCLSRRDRGHSNASAVACSVSHPRAITSLFGDADTSYSYDWHITTLIASPVQVYQTSPTATVEQRLAADQRGDDQTRDLDPTSTSAPESCNRSADSSRAVKRANTRVGAALKR